MAYWTVRTEVSDAPGRLAGISGAIAACGANIVALDVHPLGRGVVADELVVQAAVLDATALIELISLAGGERSTVTRSDPHELVDAQTRILRLLHGLSLATGRRDAALESALTVLLRAERCCLLPASAAGLSSLAERALLEGLPATGTEQGGPYSIGEHLTQVLVVPWREARGDVRLAVLSRATSTFTEIEGARARGFLMVAAVVAPKVAGPTDLLLADGTEVHVRPASASDADGVAALHARAPLGGYLLEPLEALGSLNPLERYVVVAESAGQMCAVASYERATPGWNASFDLIVDRALPSAALGGAILRRLAAVATAAGIDTLTAPVGVRRDVRLLAARASGLATTEKWSREGREVRIALQRPQNGQRASMPARVEPLSR